jgi:1-acyl-sn-glycerol-3-phosphate acyltransferase
MKLYGILARPALMSLVWILVGGSARWKGCEPARRQRVYFANHCSHIDTIALWSALPPELRKTTRPVAAKDYWGATALRKYIAVKVLNVVLIDRQKEISGANPLAPIEDALQKGDSIIIFPEGTRSEQRLPGPFKSGLFRLALKFPDVEFVPVYLENLHRSMPKGTYLPIPITCTVWFGFPITLEQGEDKDEFLARARQAIVDLS